MVDIGTIDFKIERASRELVIAPVQGPFDFTEWLQRSKAAILELLEERPVVIVRNVVLKPGFPLSKPAAPGVTPFFHIDDTKGFGETVPNLVNNNLDNRRGSTTWVQNELIVEGVRAVSHEYKNVIKGFKDPGITELSETLIERIAGETDLETARQYVNILIGLAFDHESSDELWHFWCKFNSFMRPYSSNCTWSNFDNSALLFNNRTGFHRGVYQQSSRAFPLLAVKN